MTTRKLAAVQWTVLAVLGLLFFSGCLNGADAPRDQITQPIYTGPLPGDIVGGDGLEPMYWHLLPGDGVAYHRLNVTADAISRPCATCSTYYQLHVQPSGTATSAVLMMLIDDVVVGIEHWGNQTVATWDGAVMSTTQQTTFDDPRYMRAIFPTSGEQLHILFAMENASPEAAMNVMLDPIFDRTMVPRNASSPTAAIQAPELSSSGFSYGGAREAITTASLAPGVLANVVPWRMISYGAIDVVERIPTWTPEGGARSVSYDARCDGGWGIASTAFAAVIADTAYWEHEVRAGTASAFDNGVRSSAAIYDTSTTGDTFGRPVGQARGDGNGASVHLAWTGQAMPLNYQLSVDAICFDDDWTALAGHADPPRVTIASGSVAAIRP
jgi:hypothetical protein